MVAQKSTRVAIYGLIDPRTHRIRYVGKSVHLEQRWRDHVREARYDISRRTLKGLWVRDLRAAGLRPDLIVLEECGTDWSSREKYWIKRIVGLLNETSGGQVGCKQEAAKKISAALKANKTRHGAEWRKKHSLAMRGKRHTAETKKKMAAARSGNQNALKWKYVAIDPVGNRFSIVRPEQFCNERGLNWCVMRKIAAGALHRYTNHGWRCERMKK